ncbi:MAG: hypothetical protein AAB706_00875 [Patescibacteria group bacterium]
MANLLEGFYSLLRPVNKVSETGQEEGVVSDLLPELELSMDDAELIALKKDWEKQWSPYAKEIEKKQLDNENYWLGQQFNTGDEKRPIVDNLIFESLETFLPIATRPKADPLVESDNTELGNAIADKVRKMLIYISDILSYNLKVKQVVRYWALYMLGVMKVGWSMKENDITCIATRPQKLILDPKAVIEEGEYSGYYIGEHLQDMASDLVLRFPNKKTFITDKVHDKMGTTLEYTMWTTDDYVFWTLENEVLGKNKNPHWNYETRQPLPADPITGLPPVDEMGKPMTQSVLGKNHFKNRKKPYIFLSVFNLGKQPHDETNLIQQNLPLQDLINKRLTQIDKNADNTNGGLAVSGDAFTEDQAKKAATARRKGGTIFVPTGPVSNAVVELTGSSLPPFVYDSLIDYRNELRNIFGIRGSTPQGTINEQTVRGKLVIKGQDSDRIGGGISTYLEQFSDSVFNWFVQLMYVYYDEPHFATVLGKERAQEYIQLVNTEFTSSLLVGVKEGSMIPHDPVNKRNEAMELWAAQGIDPITFFDRLEFPNPREAAKNLFLWKADPISLFPDLQAQQQQQEMMAQQQMAQQQGQQVQQQQQVEQKKSQTDRQHEIAKTMLMGQLKKK